MKIRVNSPSPLARLSARLVGVFEYLFYQHGKAVCRHPYLYIGTVLAVTAACGVGMLNFRQESRPFKLWIPQNSDFVAAHQWMMDHFPTEHRFETAILTADNVLTPSVLLEMQRIHEAVAAPPVEGPSWEQSCARLPNLLGEEEVEDEDAQKRQADIAADLDLLTVAGDEGATGAPESAARRRRRRAGAATSHSCAEAAERGSRARGERSPPTLQSAAVVRAGDAGLLRRRRQAIRPVEADFDVSTFDALDPSVMLSTTVHCFLVSQMPTPCWEASLLELWRFDRKRIEKLTQQQILDTVNSATESPVFGYRFNVSRYLGDIRRDATGRVVGAGAALLTWTVRRRTDVSPDEMVNDAGTGEPVDKETVMFENHFLSALGSTPSTPGVTWYYSAGKSFGEISHSTIFGDAMYLGLGYMIMFMYITLMLGRCNFVQQRTWLAFLGLFSVCLSVVIAYGLCSAIGVFYGPVHNILPLLLLGLGVDDMFVILQCWETLSADERTGSLEERVGRALQHAGVSITVTSITDFVAFAIGASTDLPSLRSFCIYAAVGILAVYLIQATWFVAWFTLDQRRIESRRNGCLPCIVHRNWSPNRCSQQNYFQRLFADWLSPAILSNAGKAAVLVVTAVLLAVNAWGLSMLRQEFNPLWFIPGDTYLGKYHRAAERYFPNKGADGIVFVSGVDFAENLPQLAALSRRLRAEPSVQRVESWYDEFQYYNNYHRYGELPERFYDGYDFSGMLGQFMYSPRGGKFQSFLRFNGTLECGSPAPPLLMSMVTYTHTLMDDTQQQIAAMLRLKDAIRSINFTGPEPRVEPLSEAYASWETDQVIEFELYRNMGLALVCVFIMVLLLIVDLMTSLLVLTCVLFTLVDVGGLMHFWGLTIDTVSCIDVVLAIGLCVDYAAHVGHTFLVQRGSRRQRAHGTLTDIGPAVFNGGFSTFLAFIFLADSESHVFITFFKVFLGVTVFGLWHGLVFLPVLLSLVGPQPYASVGDDVQMAPQSPPPANGRPAAADGARDGDAEAIECTELRSPAQPNGHVQNGAAVANGSADRTENHAAEVAYVPQQHPAPATAE